MCIYVKNDKDMLIKVNFPKHQVKERKTEKLEAVNLLKVTI